MNLLKDSSGISLWITSVFALLFLMSFGLFIHNASADTVTTSISAPSSNCCGLKGLTGIAVNPDTNTIYVAFRGGYQGGEGGAVYVIDSTTNDIINTISATGGPNGVAVNPVTNTIYVTNEYNYETNLKPNWHNSVFVINGSTNSISKTITVGFGPYGVSANSMTNKIYVSNYIDGTVSVIDGVTDNVVSTIQVGTHPVFVAVNPNTNLVYVANSDSNTVSVINGSTNALTSTISGFNNPEGIAVNPNTNKIYVANYNNGTLSVIDGTTDSVVGSLFVGNGAYGVNVNPMTNKIYVSIDGKYGGGDTVSVIDGSIDAYMQALQVSTGPTAIGINPTTDKIYVPSQFYDTVSVIDGSTSTTSTIPSAPTPPQNLRTTVVLGPDNYVNMSWSYPATDGGSQITNYEIFDSTSKGTETLKAVANNGLSYELFGVSCGQTYFFEVKALTSFGESDFSNEANATIPGPPQPPTGLTANAASSSQIDLSWNAPSESGCTAITGYEIERSIDGGSTWSTIVSNTGNTETTYSDTGLSSNTTYSYEVFAINSVGTSTPSNTASATTPILSVAGTNVGPVTAALP